MVKFLVENGANTNIEVENKERPLLFALKNGYDDIVEYLIEKGKVNTNFHTKSEIKDYTRDKFTIISPLIFAIKNEDLKTVKFLVDKGADVNFGDYGVKPLIFAVRGNNLEMVKFLVDRGRYY